MHRLYKYFKFLRDNENVRSNLETDDFGEAFLNTSANRNILLRAIKAEFGREICFGEDERRDMIDWRSNDDYDDYGALVNQAPTPAQLGRISSTAQKEPPVFFETKHFILGQDVSKMTVEQIVSAIALQEAQIEHLDKLKNKPKVVIDAIAAKRAAIDAAIAQLDGAAKPAA